MNATTTPSAKHPFFEGMKPNLLNILLGSAETVRFESGQMLLHEGEVASRFYLVQEGDVALITHGKGPGAKGVELERIGRGDVLGWSWLFAPYLCHFSARAVQPTEVLMLDGAKLLIACEENHEFGFELMKRIAQVVIQRLQKAREHMR